MNPNDSDGESDYSNCSTPNEWNVLDEVVGDPCDVLQGSDQSPKKRRVERAKLPEADVPKEDDDIWKEQPDFPTEAVDFSNEVVDVVKEESPNEYAFATVAEADVHEGCQNKRITEEIRNHNRAPVAAGKRFMTTMDKLENSTLNQLMNIKFDRNRTANWVAKSQGHGVNKIRPRRYSDVLDSAAFEHEELIKSEEISVEDQIFRDEMMCRNLIFTQMVNWTENRYEVMCPPPDSGRIDSPANDSVIVARVLCVAGHRATIVPAAIFEKVSQMAYDYVTRVNPPPLSDDLNERACVLFMQESDNYNEYEYRRGWVFQFNGPEVYVMLMDERRIVNVPRSHVCLCPTEIVMRAPPLCVDVEFTREIEAKKVPLLVEVGCTAKCRVMEEPKENEPLKLRLLKIDTDGRSLDFLYCCEDCAGACGNC